MELDDLKQAWQLLDQRLDRLELHTLDRRRSAGLDALRLSLRGLAWWQIVQIAAALVFCLLFAPYAVRHLELPHLAICGFSLQAYGVLMIVMGVRMLLMLRRLDYAAPVLDLQRRLAALTDWRLRVETPGFVLAGCLMWIPLTLIGFESLGVDLWIVAPAVVWSFIASGAACLAAGLIALRAMREAERLGATRGWGARWRDGSLGQRLLSAQRQLAAISQFERA